jgi:hypothetical protein
MHGTAPNARRQTWLKGLKFGNAQSANGESGKRIHRLPLYCVRATVDVLIGPDWWNRILLN